MSDNKNSWDSYFHEGSDAPDYQGADDATKAIPANFDEFSSEIDTSDTGPENFKINFDKLFKKPYKNVYEYCNQNNDCVRC